MALLVSLGAAVHGGGGGGGGVRRAGVSGAPVEAEALSAQQDEPVDLRRHDAEVAQVGGEGEVEGHAVEGQPVVLAVHPVHVGEESNATQEECEQHHAAVSLVHLAVLEAQLREGERERERSLYKESQGVKGRGREEFTHGKKVSERMTEMM